MYDNGKWNDNGAPVLPVQYSIIEFSNGGAGYPDTDPADGVSRTRGQALADTGAPKVPSVVGMTEAAATTALVDAGVTVIVEEEYSDTVAAGVVISQDPAGGTDLEGVTEVTIVVSLGEEPEIFLTQPVGGWFEAGDSLTLEAELYAPVGTASYQWQKNQGDMPGEEDPELVFDPLEESDEGHYRCVATDESAKGEFISDEVFVLVAAEGMLPVAAGAGLALLSGVCALAGAVAVRRKK